MSASDPRPTHAAKPLPSVLERDAREPRDARDADPRGRARRAAADPHPARDGAEAIDDEPSICRGID